MNLTLLPQHILQSIITETINISKPREAFSLRLVCKSFDKEVLHAAFEKDESTLLHMILSRQIRFSSNVGYFRCLRGFMLRHKPLDNRSKLWQQLNTAVTALVDHHPNVLGNSSLNGDGCSPSPNRFLNIYSRIAHNALREHAIAMICDAVLTFFGKEICLLVMLDLSWYDDEGLSENVEDKTAEFWLLMVAARRNNLDLFGSILDSFNTQKDSINTRAWIDNMADALRLPAQAGRQDMLELVLAQEGVQTQHITKKGRGRIQNAMEIAAASSQLDVVRFFLSHGVDLIQDQTDYSKCFKLALDSSSEASARQNFLDLFKSLTEEWRSKEITAGIIESICGHGDLDSVKAMVQIFETSENSARYTWQWASFGHPDSILVQAVKSHNPALVRYIIDSRKNLSSLLEDSFSAGKIVEAFETAVAESQPEILIELFKQDLPDCIMKEKLFAYAAITSKVPTLELLAKDIDLNQKFDDESPFWDLFTTNSRHGEQLVQLKCDTTPYLQEPSLLTLGSISLLYAIKSCNIEATKWLLEHGQRLGRPYWELARWMIIPRCALIMEQDKLIQGTGRVLGLSYWARWLLSFKEMHEDGTEIMPNTLIITHGRSQTEIKKLIADGKQYTRLDRFLDRFRVNFQRGRLLRDHNARVVCAIETPGLPYLEKDCNVIRETTGKKPKNFQIYDLLAKYKHPNIYIEYM